MSNREAVLRRRSSVGEIESDLTADQRAGLRGDDWEQWEEISSLARQTDTTAGADFAPREKWRAWMSQRVSNSQRICMQKKESTTNHEEDGMSRRGFCVTANQTSPSEDEDSVSEHQHDHTPFGQPSGFCAPKRNQNSAAHFCRICSHSRV